MGDDCSFLLPLQMFSNHVWEDIIEPLEIEDPAGGKAPVPLVMNDRQFRSVVSLLQDAEEMKEEELPDAQ